MLQIKMNLKYPFNKYVAFRCDLDPADMEKRKRKSLPEKKVNQQDILNLLQKRISSKFAIKKCFFFTSS